MEKIQITRVAYCPNCASEGNPKSGNVIALKGSRGWHVHFLEYTPSNQRGMVPHLFTLDKAQDGKVKGSKVCLVNGCGTDIRENGGDKPYSIYFNYKSPFSMSLLDWNSLVLDGKDLGYKLDFE